MTKNKTLFLLAFLLILLPFLGFSRAWEDSLTVFFGLAIALVTFVHVRQNRLRSNGSEYSVTRKEDVYYNESKGITGSTTEVTEHITVSNDPEIEIE